MPHLRLLRTLGLCSLAIAWSWDAAAARGATLPAESLRVPTPAVELAIREPADAASYRAFEGPVNPLEEGLFADAADGQWQEHSLLTAALIASGVDTPARLQHYDARLGELAGQLRRSPAMSGSPRQQAQAILEFLHARILRGGYRLDCTDLTIALDEGRFNCVSASVLFNCLAERLGLRALGLEIPGHAMSRLVLADGVLDVETTCPEWFRLMDDPEKQAALVEKTIGLRRSEQTPAQRRVVSGVELVATIYYNRGVDLLAQKQFAEAVAANAKALRLDPRNGTARGNLLATLNNWAIELGTAGQHAEAIRTLERGLVLDASYATFKTNYVHVYHQWADQLSQNGRFSEAADLLAQTRWKELDPSYFHSAQLELYRRWVRASLDGDRFEEAWAALTQAERKLGPVAELRELEVAELNRRAGNLLEEGRLADAVTLLDRAVAWLPQEKVLVENRRVAVMRWAQPAFEQGDYAEAIRRTTHGSQPGALHDSLINNVRYGYYQWISQLVEQGQRGEARQLAQRAVADPYLAGHTAGVVPARVND